MEMMPIWGGDVLDDTESLMSDTSFDDAFTGKGQKGFNLELKTVRGNLKHFMSKRILYNSEIWKVKEKVKRLEANKNQTGVLEEQQEVWNDDIVKAEEEIAGTMRSFF